MYVREKEIPVGSGHFYLYIQRSEREGPRVSSKHLAYLGPTSEYLTEAGFAREAAERSLSPEEQDFVRNYLAERGQRLAKNLGKLRDLPHPKTRAEAEAYAKKVRASPLVRAAEAQNQLRLEGDDTAGKHRRADGTYKPERAKLHRDIVRKLINAQAASKGKEKPQAVFLLGLPGSGKSTTLRPKVRSHWPGLEWSIIDPDAVKEELPGYQGWNASAYQEESGDVAKGPLLREAVTRRHNIMLDEVGSNAESIRARIGLLEELGYEVSVFYARVTTATSITRIVGRFITSGRWVPPSYVLDGLEDRVESTIAGLKADGVEVHIESGEGNYS